MSASRRSTGSGAASRSPAPTWIAMRPAPWSPLDAPAAPARRGRTGHRRPAVADARPQRSRSSGRSPLGRSPFGRSPSGVGRRRRARGQPAELPGPVQAHEDLAEQPLESGRLAPGAQRLDGRLGDGAGRLGRRERALVEALGRGEQPGAGYEVRVAGAARHGGQGDVAPGPWPGRHDGPGRDAARRPMPCRHPGRPGGRRRRGTRRTLPRSRPRRPPPVRHR